MSTPESVAAGLFVVATAPAGWYEINETARRWFDGHHWTDHYAPIPARAVTPRLRGGSGDVGLNVILAIMTFGAWLPVWGVLASIRGIRNLHQTRYEVSGALLAKPPLAHS